jgi:hypothetical protein
MRIQSFFVLRMNQKGYKQIAFGHDLLQKMLPDELYYSIGWLIDKHSIEAGSIKIVMLLFLVYVYFC